MIAMASHGTRIESPEPGHKVQRWTYVEEGIDARNKRAFLCRCDCGTEKLLSPTDFLQGRTRSCGCYNREVARSRATKHGDAHTRLHWVWIGMRQRCSNPDHISFKRYGAEGIRVCAAWDVFAVFRDWSLSHGYVEGAPYRQTIERVDNDGDYDPGNCTWVRPKINANNTRANHWLRAFGERKTMMQWSEDPRCQVEYYALRQRIRTGWEAEAAISAPKGAKRGALPSPRTRKVRRRVV